MTLGGVNPEDANLAQVSFTVHKSGDYTIAIMFSSRHIKGSPFIKSFEAGMKGFSFEYFFGFYIGKHNLRNNCLEIYYYYFKVYIDDFLGVYIEYEMCGFSC